jgi:hypothetical protein
LFTHSALKFWVGMSWDTERQALQQFFCDQWDSLGDGVPIEFDGAPFDTPADRGQARASRLQHYNFLPK